MSDKAIKHDLGKPQISLIPREALEQEAYALMYGANKYSRDNYKSGMEWRRLIDATLRHLIKFADKEDVDDESLISHLAHCKANLSMLIYMVENNVGEDNR